MILIFCVYTFKSFTLHAFYFNILGFFAHEPSNTLLRTHESS